VKISTAAVVACKVLDKIVPAFQMGLAWLGGRRRLQRLFSNLRNSY
jgi:hypothetical protein